MATKSIKGLDRLIITNAEDLKETDFACWISENDGVPTQLNYTYNDTSKTLTLRSNDSTPLNLLELRDIHYGHKDVDFDICEGDKAHYYRLALVKEPDLTGNYVNLWLYNFDETLTNNRLDINLTLQILNTSKEQDPHGTILAKQTSILNMYWTHNQH